MSRPGVLQVQISNQMIMDAVADYERENPGLDGWKMPPQEFSARITKKIMASTQVIEGGNA